MIASGPIHNPHFYDFQRKHGKLGRTPGDVPCGGLPDLSVIIRLCSPSILYDRNGMINKSASCSVFYTVHRLVSHIENVEMRRYAAPRVGDTLEMRIDYLTNKVTEDRFKQRLQQMEKKREKRRDINNIYMMFTQTSSDILRQFVDDKTKVRAALLVLTFPLLTPPPPFAGG